MVMMVNLVKQTFCMMLPVVLCTPGQYRVFPPIAVIIAARRRGMAKFISTMFYGVAIWRSCRLFHLGDVALLKETI